MSAASFSSSSSSSSSCVSRRVLSVTVLAVVCFASVSLFFVLDNGSSNNNVNNNNDVHNKANFENHQSRVFEAEADTVLAELNKPYRLWRANLRLRKAKGNNGGSRKSLSVHFFYVIDCREKSLWQAGVLEHSWEKNFVRNHKDEHDSVITRLVSGCFVVDDATRERRTSKSNRTNNNPIKLETPEKMRRSFFVSSSSSSNLLSGTFFTPSKSTLPNGAFYPPMNRPHSIQYWLLHADLSPEEDVFVNLDPDMIFLTDKFPTHLVRSGHPVSQFYEYMAWAVFDKSFSVKFWCEHCPFSSTRRQSKPNNNNTNTNTKFNKNAFPQVGAPYMMVPGDWRKIAPRWIQLLDELTRNTAPGDLTWIVDMIAFSFASMVEKLEHQIVHWAMVDNYNDDELWDSILDRLDITATSSNNNNNKSAAPKRSALYSTFSVSPPASVLLPSLLHYCYPIEVGKNRLNMSAPYAELVRQHHDMQQHDSLVGPVLDAFYFHKAQVPASTTEGFGISVLDCKTPLMQEFHSTGLMLRRAFGEDDEVTKKQQQRLEYHRHPVRSPRSISKRSAQMLGLLLPAINDALASYKMRYCGSGSRNLSKVLRLTHASYFFSKFEIDGSDVGGDAVRYHRWM